MRRLRKNAKNVDTTLLTRKAINDLLERAAAPGTSRGDLEEIGDRLFRMGPPIVPALVRRLEDTADDAALGQLAFLVEYLDNDAFIEPLVELLLSRRKSDRAKATFLAALQAYNVDTSDPLFADIFDRPGEALAHSASRLVEEAEGTLESQVRFLESFFGYSRPHKLAIVTELGRLDDSRAVRYLELLADHEDAEIALLAVDTLGRVRDARAVAALARLAARPDDPERAGRAERSLRRLAFAGFPVAEARARVQPPARLGPLYKVHVSRIDGQGGRALWFARRRREDGPDLTAVCLLVDDEFGLKDGFGYEEIERADYESLLRKAKKEDLLVETDFRYAVSLLRDALHRNQAGGTPYPPHFLLLRRFFEATDLAPAPYAPAFPEFDETALLDDLAALSETGSLLDRDEFDGWLLSTERVYDYADEVRALVDEDSRRQFVRRSLALHHRFFEELVRPLLPRYLSRLRLSADLLRRVGNRRRDVRLALVAAAHVEAALERQARVPVADQPFVHRLIFESLDLAVTALNDGYDLRKETEEE
jgi:hypothetical protein